MRMYHVIVRNDRTNMDTYMTVKPVTHAEGCVILSKLMRRPKHLRAMLVNVN